MRTVGSAPSGPPARRPHHVTNAMSPRATEQPRVQGIASGDTVCSGRWERVAWGVRSVPATTSYAATSR
jgi:hypothetical protein